MDFSETFGEVSDRRRERKPAKRRGSKRPEDRSSDQAAAAAPQQPAPLKPEVPAAWRDVLAERRRQVEVEGWTPEHDDAHTKGSMAVAAACYAAWSLPSRPASEAVAALWPWTGWAQRWFKPKGERHNLIRAGALILAEIERLDRAIDRASAAPRKATRAPCSLGVGCDESGVCYAAAHGQPDQCGATDSEGGTPD